MVATVSGSSPLTEQRDQKWRSERPGGRDCRTGAQIGVGLGGGGVLQEEVVELESEADP